MNYTKNCRKALSAQKMVEGVKFDSVLNILLYFHVCNSGLTSCTGHDLFEGVIPFDLMLAFKYFIANGWFTYEELNERINNFKFFGENEQTIPPIKDGMKLTGTASEIRRILLIFPIIIADKVKDFEDNVWNMLMLLREVCSLVCSPALFVEKITLLQDERPLQS